ncbi:uncharacterized protein LOC120916330 [Rana temporaria]|uniref:uncharacterized protein LOC120916330 n=1 Tax=Rana temporaria TaxID=8407 RepID=UPI001AACBBB7|nr:uncharacterized protein LOC120916330 [Rana temporaria]
MMSVVQLCFLLSALAGFSYSIMCNYCTAYDDIPRNCTSTIDCPANYRCSATVTEHYKDFSKEIMETSVIHRCVPESYCDTFGSYSLQTERKWMGITCCDTDYCFPDQLADIKTNNELTGVTCPVCSSNTSSTCEPEGTMQCRGEEYNCIRIYTVTKYYYYESVFYNGYYYMGGSKTVQEESSIRGCATDSFCDFGSEMMLGDHSRMETIYNCTDGAEERSGFPTTLIFCCIAQILLYLFIF